MTAFGLSVAASLREPIIRIADLVARAERKGFQYAFVLDSQMAFKEAYVTLAVCAERTESIRLGTGVTNPITRDLTVTAAAISAIADVSGGRAVLGIGNGGTSTDGIGVRNARLAEMREATIKLRRLLDGEEVTHHDLPIRMQPAGSQIPILVSGSRPRMLRLAGEIADGVILMGSSHPRLLTLQLEQVYAGLEQSGRSRASFHVDLWQTISVQDDRQRAIEDVKSWVASQLVYWFARADSLPPELEEVVDRDKLAAANAQYSVRDHLSLQAEHRELVSEELADLMTIAGDERHAVRRLRELGQLDVDSITLTLLSGGREERVEVLGRVIEGASLPGHARV